MAIRDWGKSFRFFTMLTLALSAVGVGGSFFSQYVLDMHPCNMCILQRAAMIALLLVSAALVFIPPKKLWSRVLETILLLAPAIAGITVSIRQIWLQSLPPDKIPGCGPGFEFIWKTNPKLDALKILFMGDGDCAKVERVLGVPLPIWATLFFGFIILMTLYAFFFTRRKG